MSISFFCHCSICSDAFFEYVTVGIGAFMAGIFLVLIGVMGKE